MAFDAFLKIDGIPGESTDDKHKDWIEVSSFNLGISQPSAGAASSGGARSAERADFDDFSVTKALDKASPKLSVYVCKGDHIKEVKLELCRATGEKSKYMEYKMEDVLVTSHRPGGSSQGGESLPTEEVSFNYGKITWTYTETDHKTGKAKGNLSTHWSLVENKGG